jgi:hypothetical protein
MAKARKGQEKTANFIGKTACAIFAGKAAIRNRRCVLWVGGGGKGAGVRIANVTNNSKSA